MGAVVLVALVVVGLIAASIALAQHDEPGPGRVSAERAALERVWSSIDPTTRLDVCNGYKNVDARETVRQFVELSDGAFSTEVVGTFLGSKC